MKQIINVEVNGILYNELIDIRLSLLEFLRDVLGLTGVKQGCKVGECGGCSVIIDDVLVDSCIYLAVWANEKSVTTIEGISDGENLSDVQKSFIDMGAVQCGFCTPGLVIATTNLLKNNPNPTEKEIRRGLSGNLCRCTGYVKIIDAVNNTVLNREELKEK